MAPVKGISTFVGVVSVAVLLSLNSVSWSRDIRAIRLQAYKDAVKKYEIVKKIGDRREACMHAGRVSDAALETQNEALYISAKSEQRVACIYSEDGASSSLQSDLDRGKMISESNGIKIVPILYTIDSERN